MGRRLDEAERDTDDIPPKHPLSDEEKGDVEEDAADAGVALAQGFQNPNHVRALEDDNEQTGYHGEAGDRHHEDEDDDDVDVQYVEPAENHGI